jgi:type I restriction-modification system DNA methylase subunit
MAIKLNKNERSWAIQIIQKISQYVQDRQDCVIKLAGGETTINTGNERMFPDVLLFADMEQSFILQGWELKMPDVPIDDSVFVHDAWRKADNLNLNSCVIWNFRYGVFYVKNSESGEFEKAEEWNNSSYISENRTDVETYINKWLPVIYEIIDKVNKFFVTQSISPVQKSNVFVNRVSEEFIAQNKVALGEHYKELAGNDSVFDSFINLWWDGAQTEYIKDEENKYNAYAKVILLGWMNKLFFANVLKNYYPTPNEVVKVSVCERPQNAVAIFKTITEKCDFYSIFKPIDYEDNLPELVWSRIKETADFLGNSDLSKVDQNDMRSLLESAVKASQRIIIGQYTTPYELALFMIRIAVKSAHDVCFDPCCGTGTFARAALAYKAEKEISVEEQYKTVFAEDRQNFPLQIAGLSTVTKDSVKVPSIVFQGNVFDQKVGNRITVVNPNDGSPVNFELPEFDSIISNLPFIDFCRNNIHNTEDERTKNLVKEKVKTDTNITLSKRSDYYMYIMFHLWTLLKFGGSICVVTSNSWLGTETGNVFLCALAHYYNVKGVFISGGKRWFSQASVVTTVWLLEKKKIASQDINTQIKFYLLNCDLSSLNDRGILNKAVGTVLQDRELDNNIIQVNSYSWKNLDYFSKLNLSFNICFCDVKWILNLKEKLLPISNAFKIIRGIKTGQDPIFFPASKDVVDSEYIDSILHDSKTCKTLTASPDDFFINCSKSYDELKSLGHTKTINYFKQFEGHLNQSVLSHGSIWYALKDAIKKPVIITGMNPHERLFFAKFNNPACINQRLIGFTPVNEDVDIELCHALLNSVLQLFFVESAGFGKGEGALDTSKDNIEKLFMLNPSLLTIEQRSGILEAFEPLKNRNVLTTMQEMEQEDRIKFDHCVLSAYGIDNLYEKIRDTLRKMQNRRLSV